MKRVAEHADCKDDATKRSTHMSVEPQVGGWALAYQLVRWCCCLSGPFRLNDLCTIMYTSSTTGWGLGCIGVNDTYFVVYLLGLGLERATQA
jgi:long-subunit acyl-CoA synthetase (AMP-forming)